MEQKSIHFRRTSSPSMFVPPLPPPFFTDFSRELVSQLSPPPATATLTLPVRPPPHGSFDSLTREMEKDEEVLDYLNTTLSLFFSLPTDSWLLQSSIYPSLSRTYTLDQFQAVAVAQHGGTAIWNCVNATLTEVWWGFESVGRFQEGIFVGVDALGQSNCPEEGIKWLPKNRKVLSGCRK